MTTRRRHWMWRAVATLAAASVLGGGGLLVFNSAAWPARSRDEFATQLDDALRRSTEWMIAHPELENTALLHMIADMSQMSGDARLRDIASRFLNGATDSLSLWRRLVDPTWPRVQGALRSELDLYQEYQRWMLYGAAPDLVPLTAEERDNMFSPDRYWWGKRTHQLFALLFYRDRKPETAGLASLIDTLAVRIAREQRWDVRVTDLYFQRAAFLLAAGRPDLVQRRWIERILDHQQSDGGWIEAWHGFGPGAFAFTTATQHSTSHPTVQAAWILCMLKYRYPAWATAH
jgi:hypothetical protein